MARVYIHEFVDVIGTERARYQHHMTANWCPEAGPLRRQLCFGVFSVVGSTGRWPQVVNLWEYAGWDDLAHNFGVELVGSGHRDPMLDEWWTRAAGFRTGGLDRILVAHEDSPGIEQWCTLGGTGAVAYLHEILHTPVSGAPQLCDELVGSVAGRHRRLGLQLVGAFRTALRADDEVVVIWAVPDWETWARVEAATDAAAIGSAGSGETGSSDTGSGDTGGATDALSAGSGVRVLSRERILLVDAELSPLRIGRQPVAEDRRSLDEF